MFLLAFKFASLYLISYWNNYLEVYSINKTNSIIIGLFLYLFICRSFDNDASSLDYKIDFKSISINPLNTKLNPICHLLVL
jgi:hypothetical protein